MYLIAQAKSWYKYPTYEDLTVNRLEYVIIQIYHFNLWVKGKQLRPVRCCFPQQHLLYAIKNSCATQSHPYRQLNQRLTCDCLQIPAIPPFLKMRTYSVYGQILDLDTPWSGFGVKVFSTSGGYFSQPGLEDAFNHSQSV